MIISKENILSVIPQRPPFVMIDCLVSCNEISSATTLNVREDNILVYEGELSEAGLIENIAQTAAAGLGYKSLSTGEPIFTGYIGAVKNLEIFKQPQIGEVLETEVAIENQIFDVTIITGKVKSNDALIAKCEMKIFVQK